MDTSSLHGRQKIYLSFIQNKEDRTFVFQLIKILWTHNLSRDIPINSPYFSTSNEAKKLYQKKISESKEADAPFNLYNLLNAAALQGGPDDARNPHNLNCRPEKNSSL